MFQQDSAHALLHRFLPLLLLLATGVKIARGHNFPRNVSIPGVGDLIGYYNNHSEVISFVGIPYAKPPTGELRFQLPEPFTWNGTRNATSEPRMCIQPVFDESDPPTSENCLYLSVYVPGNIIDKNSNLPVMVWIHGGGFKYGYGNFLNVRSLASFGNVIVVTINYRLSIFGFLSSGDGTLPGNAGLHDQVMALKWVKANIRPFGGDPNKVTIFGQSSGATSVYILVASPTVTDGLFARAIMQSGFIWPMTDPKKSFKTIANLTSCPHIHVHGKDHDYSTRKQIECMKSKSVEELLAIIRNPQAPRLSPIIDNVFLNSDILKQLSAKKKIIPSLIGINNNELIKTSEVISDIDALKKQLASLGERSFGPMAVDLMLSKFLTSDLKKTFIDSFLSMAHALTHKITMHVSEPKETYMYYFTHHPSFTRPNNYNGAKHNDELRFVFGDFKKNSSVTSDEKMLSKDMIGIWSSFARAGRSKMNIALCGCIRVLLIGILWGVLLGSPLCEGRIHPSVVTTKYGTIRGHYDDTTNVTQYRSIPYARPPIGELRFREPQPVQPWKEILNGTRNPPACMQRRHPLPNRRPETVSEDCLYLNIYVPGTQPEVSFRSHPVLVWIHGGDFVYGYSSFIDFSFLSNRGQMIIVSIGYRFDIFGFLSSGDESLPGNAGLLDQHLALEWVKDNIESFGGDPSRITLYGESTGATFVYHHVASPGVKGLFSRAIIGGGVFIEGVDSQSTFKKVTQALECDKDHSLDEFRTEDDMIMDIPDNRPRDDHVEPFDPLRCLQNRSAKSLLEISMTLPRYSFIPVVDSHFVPLSLTEAFSLNSSRSGVPFGISCLIGINSDGVNIPREWNHNGRETLLSGLDALGETRTPNDVRDLIQLAVRSKYYSDRQPYTRSLRNAHNGKYASFIQAVCEAMSSVPTEPVFLYYFNMKSSFVKTGDDISAGPTDELPFIFGNVLKDEGLNSTLAEKQLSSDMIEIWSSFIADGVPQLPNGVKWPPYGKDRCYVELNVNITEDNVKQRLRESDRIFWNELIPKIEKMNPGPMNDTMKDQMGKMTTMPGMHHHKTGISIAWGMSEQAVQDLLMSLLILLIFMTVITVTLILILCKIRTIKLAATRHNGILDNKISATGMGNVNNAFINDTNKSKIESITKL